MLTLGLIGIHRIDANTWSYRYHFIFRFTPFLMLTVGGFLSDQKVLMLTVGRFKKKPFDAAIHLKVSN